MRRPQESERLHLHDMLQAPCSRGAESQRDRGHRAAGRMPAAVAEEHQHGKRRQTEIGENHAVELAEAGNRLKISEQKRRREDQRLRIGDLRRPGEDIMRPERRLAGMQRIGKKLDLRLEMRFAIVREL